MTAGWTGPFAHRFAGRGSRLRNVSGINRRRCLTRQAACAVIVVRIGAITKVHWPHGVFLTWDLTPGMGHGMEATLAFLAMALACLFAGGRARFPNGSGTKK